MAAPAALPKHDWLQLAQYDLQPPLPGALPKHQPDAIVAAYPPLADYGAIAFPGMPCTRSVLLLAAYRVWALDNKNIDKKYESRDPTPVLHVGVPPMMTIAELYRRLQRQGIDRFPVYTYNAQDNLFTLDSGKARPDHYAIVLVPADPPALLLPHFTFTTVLPPEPTDRVYPPQGALIVYTAYPLAPQQSPTPLYWRCRLNTANAEAFTAAGAFACSCPWYRVCEHETQFTIQHLAFVRRVTLAANELVGCWTGLNPHGTSARGQFLASLDKSFVLERGCENSVLIKHKGQVHKESFMYGTLAIEYQRALDTWRAFIGETPLITPILSVCIVVWPYRVMAYQYATPPEDVTLFNFVKSAMSNVLDFQRVHDIRPKCPEMGWGVVDDLVGFELPKAHELMSRLAARPEVTKEVAIDTLRRLANEEAWEKTIPREEVQAWLKRVTTVAGATPQPGVGVGCCYGCRQKAKLYRLQCRACKARALAVAPERLVGTDTIAVHVGFRRSWSTLFTFPKFEFKTVDYPGAKSFKTKIVSWLIVNRNQKIMSYEAFCRWYKRQDIVTTPRATLCGPMFNHCEPITYPRGAPVAAAAFCVRLGSLSLHVPSRLVYDLAFQLTKPHILRLTPDSTRAFLSNYSAAKRAKMEEAYRMECEGWLDVTEHVEAVYTQYGIFDQTVLRVRMGGFTKQENGYDAEYDMDYSWTLKSTMKPRFICSPEPIILMKLGPYTHSQTKWLAHTFRCTHRMFYAGCATPSEMNRWLNFTHTELGGFITIVDDITAIDSNHSFESFEYHERVRNLQFPDLPRLIELLYSGEMVFKVRIGTLMAYVSFVNASGVSDTSYKNSLICLFIRAIAVASAVYGYKSLIARPDAAECVNRVLQCTYQAASGDDGIVRCPRYICGVDITTTQALEEYRAAWAAAGFSVKVKCLPEHRWRMGTFLAQRPVWNGSEYEWAPEPARRMRKMFWQLDSSLHPFSWGRGVATQVLQQGRCCVPLAIVCEWYLSRTSGPVAALEVEQHNPMAGHRSTGFIDERTLSEFYVDYRVDAHDVHVFKTLLNNSPTVTIDISCHLLDRILCEES